MSDDDAMPAPDAESRSPGHRSPLERFLGLFADVAGGEGVNVALMFANIFLILTAYYVLKVVREGLTIGGIQLFGLGGDEIKAYLPALMTLLLLVAVWIALNIGIAREHRKMVPEDRGVRV
jgi:AAA family ATP:ADP antiporter